MKPTQISNIRTFRMSSSIKLQTSPRKRNKSSKMHAAQELIQAFKITSLSMNPNSPQGQTQTSGTGGNNARHNQSPSNNQSQLQDVSAYARSLLIGHQTSDSNGISPNYLSERHIVPYSEILYNRYQADHSVQTNAADQPAQLPASATTQDNRQLHERGNDRECAMAQAYDFLSSNSIPPLISNRLL
jgi:hypothetical protein